VGYRAQFAGVWDCSCAGGVWSCSICWGLGLFVRGLGLFVRGLGLSVCGRAGFAGGL
jgi:hypothetical protein